MQPAFSFSRFSDLWTTRYLNYNCFELLCYRQSDSNSRLSEEEQRKDTATEEAVDDVDLEVQRLLSVYDLVKDEESVSRLVEFYYINWFTIKVRPMQIHVAVIAIISDLTYKQGKSPVNCALYLPVPFHIACLFRHSNIGS